MRRLTPLGADEEVVVHAFGGWIALGAVRQLGPRLGRYAGQFVSPHNIATDSRGNLYVAEDLGGQRVQKFVLKGVVGAPQR